MRSTQFWVTYASYIVIYYLHPLAYVNSVRLIAFLGVPSGLLGAKYVVVSVFISFQRYSFIAFPLYIYFITLS